MGSMFGRTKRQRAAKEEAIVRRHRPDYQIVLFSGVLMLLGLVVLYAISPARVELINLAGSELDQAHFMQKQLLYLFIGLVGFGIAAAVPLDWWQRYATKLLIAALGLSVLLFILGFAGSDLALCTNGACRWFNLGFITLQPAEFLKFALLIYLAMFLGRRIGQGNINSVSETLVPVGVILAIAVVLVIGLQKDMGTGVTLLGMVAAMLFIGGLKVRYFAVGLAAVAAVGVLFIVSSPHRIERVETFLNPALNDPASNYHITQATIAIGSGGLTGVGLGKSIQAFGYLPEAINDSIFAIMGEVFGFIGAVVILVIFFALLLRLLKVVDHTVDPTRRILVAGVFGWIATHAVVNVGAMIGVLPLTGVTLPFLSFGGSSLLFTMMALGVAFWVSRFTTHQNTVSDNQKEGDKNNASTRSRRGIGRSRYASSRGY
jgi:cell division protein FtsW